ncbi:hypothetical protein LTS08_000209 [Lithohypha guttulata]|nr:hypothetical protein LTS08_000209 [Lithohypha guttulata]
MSTVILSINAGSSSLKTTLYAYGKEKQLKSLAKAEVSSINSQPAQLKYTSSATQDKQDVDNIKDHKAAFERVLNAFLDDGSLKEVQSKDDIRYACHRVVQGGDFHEDQLITKETFDKIEALEDLAPLHNKSAVDLMLACHEHLPNVTNVACFDSAFHQTMPEHVKSYMIDQKVAKEKGLRKYGFHGLSYSYILRTVAGHLGKPKEDISIIALHLGSGASACAIRKGKSIDTTMGLTPVSGLPGGTRSGDVDPALIFHYTSEASKLSPSSTKDLHISTAEEILNKKSGWKAVAGTSNFAEIAKSDASQESQLALDIFIDRIVGFVGNYYVKLGGEVDAIVFAGGIGEKSAMLRKMVIEKVSCLGFTVDDQKNEHLEEGTIVTIGEHNTKKTLVCQTDEDYEMAYNTMMHPK